MRKFIMLLIIVISISLIFFGISCKVEGPAEKEVETVEQVEEVEEVKKFDGTKISVIYMSGPYADAARAITEKFKEMTGIEVEVIDSPFEGLHEKIFTELIAGTGNFDVITVTQQWLGEAEPYLEPLDSYINNEGYDTSDFIASSLQTYNFLGKQLGLPFINDVYSIVYRTDLFEENGITPNPNWTWDEYHEVAKKLTKEDVYGTAIAGVKHQCNVYFMNRYWALGGKEATEDWEVTINNDTAIKALELIEESLKYSPPGARGGDISDQNNMFLTGQSAMAELWTTLIVGMLDDPDQSAVVGKWGVLPEPGNGDIYAATWCISVAKDSENKEAAWEWVKFYTSKENQGLAFNNFGVMSARESVLLSPDVLSEKPWLETYLIGLKRGRPSWRIPATNEAWEGVMNDEVSKYISQQQSAEETVENIQEQWETILETSPPPEGYKNIWPPE